MIKLNLQNEGYVEGFWNSLKTYGRYIVKAIKLIKDKSEEFIIDLYEGFRNTCEFRFFHGIFQRTSKPVENIIYPITDNFLGTLTDVKISEASLDVQDFFYQWILNPLIKLNATGNLKEKDLKELQKSVRSKDSQNFIMKYISDLSNTFSAYQSENTSTSHASSTKEQSSMNSLTKFEWFSLGFACCFLLTGIYTYIKHMNEDFNNYQEFLEAIEEWKNSPTNPPNEENIEENIENVGIALINFSFLYL
ncbi:hypothetical protein TNIN_173141 [Trichonephila inaurata madagascariensis]|uniref:Uncharacterized protein n=1 Tax=Trichonephila inaurata madagascariensis TaxID=2747483 RepID=A0A8X6X6F5_9ARAC|nr:hypothetical protein TNIN_173141 [Trichonephila inaurata madagascariensis]